MAADQGRRSTSWETHPFVAGAADLMALLGMPVEGEPGLRERKKAVTRAALIEASQRLFLERGYTETTLDQIADACDVTTQTLLRYFESKAQLALTPLVEPLEALERLLTSPGRAVDTLTVWRAYVQIEAREAARPSTAATATYVENLRAYREWLDKDPALVASYADVEMWLQGVLAAALARDAGAPADDLHSTLVAALLVAGRRAVWERWLARGSDPDALVAEQTAVVEYAIGSLPRSGADHLFDAST